MYRPEAKRIIQLLKIYCFIPNDLKDEFVERVEKTTDNEKLQELLKYFKMNYHRQNSPFKKLIDYTFNVFEEDEIAKVTNNI